MARLAKTEACQINSKRSPLWNSRFVIFDDMEVVTDEEERSTIQQVDLHST